MAVHVVGGEGVWVCSGPAENERRGRGPPTKFHVSAWACGSRVGRRDVARSMPCTAENAPPPITASPFPIWFHYARLAGSKLAAAAVGAFSSVPFGGAPDMTVSGRKLN